MRPAPSRAAMIPPSSATEIQIHFQILALSSRQSFLGNHPVTLAAIS
jgi:hypothetical protein